MFSKWIGVYSWVEGSFWWWSLWTSLQYWLRHSPLWLRQTWHQLGADDIRWMITSCDISHQTCRIRANNSSRVLNFFPLSFFLIMEPFGKLRFYHYILAPKLNVTYIFWPSLKWYSNFIIQKWSKPYII